MHFDQSERAQGPIYIRTINKQVFPNSVTRKIARLFGRKLVCGKLEN